MREFASRGLRLWNLSREAKLVYTGFCLCALLALLSSIALFEDMVGLSGSGTRRYYRGDDAPTAAATGNTGGPKIEMPDEVKDAAPLTVAPSYRKLLEVSHFHLFTVPVFLLIIAHLFLLTDVSSRGKTAWIVAGWLSSLLHLAAPWLCRYGGPRAAPLFPLSGAAMTVALTVMTAYPLWQMWARKPTRPARE